MTTLVRRTIDELIARYELEESICDIFVEGSFDRDLLSNVANNNKIDAYIYEINSVQVPAELLKKHGFTEGNKQRVITLARELSQHNTSKSYRCIVDRDLDTWFSSLETTQGLTWTAYSSIEMYFFSKEILQDIILITAKSKIPNFDQYISSLIDILKKLFELRLADKDLGWNLEWISLHKFISKENSKLKFDFDLYINRLLIKNGRAKLTKSFNDKVHQWEEDLSGDYRLFIRGHDFTELIAQSIRLFVGIFDFASQTTIERLFILLAPNNPSIAELIR